MSKTTNDIKSYHTEANKLGRLKFCINKIEEARKRNGSYQSGEKMNFIDFDTKRSTSFFLPDKFLPNCTAKSRKFVLKVVLKNYEFCHRTA